VGAGIAPSPLPSPHPPPPPQPLMRDPYRANLGGPRRIRHPHSGNWLISSRPAPTSTSATTSSPIPKPLPRPLKFPGVLDSLSYEHPLVVPQFMHL
jgi:hypothetical protein